MKIRSEEELMAAQELVGTLMNTDNTESGQFYLAQQDMLDWVTGCQNHRGVFDRKFEEYGPAIVARAKARKAMKEVLDPIETAILFYESTCAPGAHVAKLMGDARKGIIKAQRNLSGMSGDAVHEINGRLIDALRRLDDGYADSVKDAHDALVEGAHFARRVISGDPGFVAFGRPDEPK